jgi:crotonobetainyl-CoA:carnitine CoA-transferase CaiB-like acyl-CoA transferase
LAGRNGTPSAAAWKRRTFPASDGSVVIIAYADDMWARGVKALDAEAMDRPEYKTAAGRRLHRERLVADLSAVTSRLTCADILQRLGKARVVVSKVNSVGEAADHPQLRAAGGFVDFEVGGQPVRSVAAPFKLSRTPTRFRRPPPQLGSHTAEILQELGVDDADVARLRAAGAFGSREAGNEDSQAGSR